MKLKHINEGFTCSVCGAEVAPSTGSCRDHCTACLVSMHVDDALPGDRASNCTGILRPLYAVYHQKKGFMIYYRCSTCGIERNNKAAEDDDQNALTKQVLKANIRAAGLEQ